MEIVSGIGLTIIYFVFALFILVLVHELGHFLAAKAFGMRVDQFSIGFPPRLFGKKIGDTDYCISATPLGGYVKIAGMIDESMDDSFVESEPKDWEYRSKPVWQRFIVMIAGVAFNVFLAAIIFGMMLFYYGKEVFPADKVGSFYIPETSVAYEIGFRTGDEILNINGERPEVYEQAGIITLSQLTSRNLYFTVLRNGNQITIQAPDNFLDYLSRNPEFITIMNALPSDISRVIGGTPAQASGLKDGDRIIAIDGKQVGYWLQIVNLIENSEGQMMITVERGSEILTLSVTPDPATKRIGIAPIDPVEYFGVEFVNQGFFTSLGGGVKQTWETTNSIISGFAMMFSGTISVRDNLGGPVAIASVTKDVTESGGARGFWAFVAFLSITLAIVNMLPIPVLDGGHVMFLLYEAVTRREPSVKVRMALQQIGIVLIIGIFIFVTFNDIMRHIVN
jgi:regulator of sigma E protease